MIVPVLDIVIILQLSTPPELHYVQDTLIFENNADIEDDFIILISEIVLTVFSNLTLEIDSVAEHIFLGIVNHQDHVEDIHLHLEYLPKLFNQIRLKIIFTTLKTFQREQTNLKSLSSKLN